MRYALAIAVLALALPAALWVHQRHVTIQAKTYDPVRRTSLTYPKRTHPSWQDPVALLIALGGVAAAVGIVFYKPR